MLGWRSTKRIWSTASYSTSRPSTGSSTWSLTQRRRWISGFAASATSAASTQLMTVRATSRHSVSTVQYTRYCSIACICIHPYFFNPILRILRLGSQSSAASSQMSYQDWTRCHCVIAQLQHYLIVFLATAAMALCCLFDSLRGTECARAALFSRVSQPRSNDPCVDPCVVWRLTLHLFPVLSNQSLVCLLVSLSLFCFFALIWISGGFFFTRWFSYYFPSSWFALWGPCSFLVCSLRLCLLHFLLSSIKCHTLCFGEIKQERLADCCLIVTAPRTSVHLSNHDAHYAATRTSFPNNGVFLFFFCNCLSNIGGFVGWPRRPRP